MISEYLFCGGRVVLSCNVEESLRAQSSLLFVSSFALGSFN